MPEKTIFVLNDLIEALSGESDIDTIANYIIFLS